MFIGTFSLQIGQGIISWSFGHHLTNTLYMSRAQDTSIQVYIVASREIRTFSNEPRCISRLGTHRAHRRARTCSFATLFARHVTPDTYSRVNQLACMSRMRPRLGSARQQNWEAPAVENRRVRSNVCTAR